MIPIIKTPRLILRPLEARDFDDYFEYAQDPEVSASGMWLSYESQADAQKDFDHLLTLYDRGLMWWGIEERASGKMIGRCELSDYDQQSAKAEVSYALHRSFWGRGYMSEALSLVVAYGFDTLKLNRIGAKVFTDNVASIQLLEKLGMKQEGRLRQYEGVRGQPEDVFIYSLLCEDRNHSRE